MSHPHPELGPPPPLAGTGLRFVALGGLGEIGRNMAVLETQGRLLVIDCGVLFPEDHHPGVDLILPDFSYLDERHRDIEAIVLTHGHEDHIGAVPYVLARYPGIPLIGSRLTLALVEAKLKEHRITPYCLTVKEGQRERLGVFDLEFVAVNHSIPDALAVMVRTRGRHRAAHRRLQDGPAAAGRADHRPARVRPPRGGRRRPVPRRLDERRRPGVHRARAGHLLGDRQGVPARAAADHRRLLRLARAPRAAGARRGREGGAQGRHGRPLDGAQHDDRCRAGLPARPRRCARRRAAPG